MTDRMREKRWTEILADRYGDPLAWSAIVDELIAARKADLEYIEELKAVLSDLLEDGGFYISAIEINTHISKFDGEEYEERMKKLLEGDHDPRREVMWENMNGMIIYTYEVGPNSRNIEMDEGPWKRIGFTDD